MTWAILAAVLLNFTVRGWLPPEVACLALLPLLLILLRTSSPIRAALLTAVASGGLAVAAFEGALPAIPWLFPVLVVIGCAPFLLPGLVAARIARKGTRMVALWSIPFTWVAAEVVASQHWLWGQFASPIALGYSQAKGPLLPLATLSGVNTVSLAVLLLNASAASLLLAVRSRSSARTGLAACVALTVLFLSFTIEVNSSSQQSESTRVALVQPVLPLELYEAANHSEIALSHIVSHLRELTGRAEEQPDLIVLPEAALPDAAVPEARGAAKSGSSAERFQEAYLEGLAQPELLAGAITRFDGRSYNSVLYSDGQRPERVFDKLTPVPVGEGHITPGNRLTVGSWAERLIAPLICLDALHPDFSRRLAALGAELIVVMSDDSFAAGMSTPDLHLRATVLRAVENAVPVLFSSASGPSALIGSDGTISRSAPVGETAVLSVRAPSRTGTTTYTRFGNWLGAVSCFLSVLLLGFTHVAGERSRVRPPRSAVSA